MYLHIYRCNLKKKVDLYIYICVDVNLEIDEGRILRRNRHQCDFLHFLLSVLNSFVNWQSS